MRRIGSWISSKLGIACALFLLMSITCAICGIPINILNLSIRSSDVPVNTEGVAVNVLNITLDSAKKIDPAPKKEAVKDTTTTENVAPESDTPKTSDPELDVSKKDEKVSATSAIVEEPTSIIADVDVKTKLYVDNDKFTKKYDAYFNKYSKRYFGVGFDYRWFKAQGLAESLLNDSALSHCGARGIMQIMPPTFVEIKIKNKQIVGSIDNPRWNIEAGIYYDKLMFDKWKAKRPIKDRLSFMFASYNAGFGNILKGQKQCLSRCPTKNCNLWENITPVAKYVDRWIYKETLGYVNRIFRYMRT